jgi:hypothetical protein
MRGIRPVSILLLSSVLACWSCDTTEPIENDADVGVLVCIDNDGDSYGVNCSPGLDCDDGDATIWDTCAGPDRCAAPNIGCPCANEGEAIECRTSEPVVSPDGATLCWAGTRTCEAGVWSGCEGMSSYDPSGTDDQEFSGGDGAYRQPLLRPSQPCTGSCEQSCKQIYECPSGMDLDATNSLNLTYDTFPPPGYTAAVVIETDESEGIWARVFDSNCPDGTMPHWWSIDYDVPYASASSTIMIYAATAADSGDLDMLNDVPDDYAVVAECPGNCDRPDDPDNRADPDDGNIENPPGGEPGDPINTRLRYLGLRVQWDHSDPGEASARMYHYWVYYFCDQAT